MTSKKNFWAFFGTLPNIPGKLLSKFFIVLIKGYQYTLSPLIGRQCRYYPTCSNYSIEAFQKYGPLKGFYLSIKRILSCNPWGGHGFDPIP